jgi:protoporphyrinogen oxidase
MRRPALVFSMLTLQATVVIGMEIAVIGAGIGAGAFSYYHSELSPGSQIHAFERRDYIGGRLKHTEIAGHTVELGGDAWSSANEYVVALVKKLGINTTLASRRLPIRLTKLVEDRTAQY